MYLPYGHITSRFLSLIFILPMVFPKSSNLVYFDRYGDCWSQEPFYVEEEPFIVEAIGSGEPYQIVKCELNFKTDADEKLCLKFNSFDVRDPSVSLLVYGHKSANGENYMNKFYSDSTPSTVCSKTRYITLVLQKKRLDSIDYSFQLEILQEKMNKQGFSSGASGEVFVSLTVLVALILGVAALIAVGAIIIVCCKRSRSKHHGKVNRKKKKNTRPGHQLGLLEQQHDTALQPTAPPLQDTEVSPPYAGVGELPCGNNYPMEPPPPYEILASIDQSQKGIPTSV